MKFIPFLFQPEMIRANLEDRKIMTRRIVTERNSLCDTLMTGDGQGWHSFDFNDAVLDGKFGEKKNYWYIKVAVPADGTRHRIFCRWHEGDVIWARETFQQTDVSYSIDPGYVFKATDPDWDTFKDWKWKPAIHMPKQACRLWLEITEIKVERVQDISKEDAIAEGIHREWDGTAYWYQNYTYVQNTIITESNRAMFKQDPIKSFRSLWIKINGQEKWDSNPLVWAPTYKRIEMPESFLKSQKNIPQKA